MNALSEVIYYPKQWIACNPIYSASFFLTLFKILLKRDHPLLPFIPQFIINTLEAQRKVLRTPNRKIIVRNTPRTIIYYARPARTIRIIRTLPARAFRLTYGGLHYYYHAGLYYKPYWGGYIIVTAPVGLRIRNLPVGFTKIIVSGSHYYFHSGVFYVHHVEGDYNFQVVEAPVGAIVEELPDDIEKVEIDGQSYYEYNDVIYAKIKRGYEVVGSVSVDKDSDY